MQRILEQHVGGGEFIDDLGIPGISPEPLEPTADNSLVVLFARHGIDPPLWLKASPPSNRVVSTSEVGGSYIRILRSDSAVFGGRQPGWSYRASAVGSSSISATGSLWGF